MCARPSSSATSSARLDSISFKSYTTLSAFLARAVPELLKQTPPA